MKLTNKLNLPQPIYDAIKNHDYVKIDNTISVTTLIDSPWIKYLKNKHHGEIEEDVCDRIYAMMGTAIHKVLEKADKTGLTEKRLSIEIDGTKIVGQFDRLCLIDGILQDYKFASIWEYIHGLDFKKIAQLNCYAYLLKQSGFEMKKLENIFIFRDWQKSKAKYDKSYPRQQIAIIRVDLWDEEKQLQYIKDRVKLHTSKNVDICTKEDRWERGEKWALMQKGKKRAIKLLDDEISANKLKEYYEEHELGKGLYIEHRPGVNVRCEDYCNVNKFCEFYLTNCNKENNNQLNNSEVNNNE